MSCTVYFKYILKTTVCKTYCNFVRVNIEKNLHLVLQFSTITRAKSEISVRFFGSIKVCSCFNKKGSKTA